MVSAPVTQARNAIGQIDGRPCFMETCGNLSKMQLRTPGPLMFNAGVIGKLCITENTLSDTFKISNVMQNRLTAAVFAQKVIPVAPSSL